jgi:geranylgeranyl diphosphate synthase type I
VELAEQQLEEQTARRAKSVAQYGFPALLGIDGIRRAHQGSSRVSAHVMGASYLAHGGERGRGAVPERSLALIAAAHEAFMDATLIHEDVAARSDVRRGQRSLHRHYADLHHDSDWMGDSGRMGAALAQLIGDAILVSAGEMFAEALGQTPEPQRTYMVGLQRTGQLERILGQAMDTIYPYLPDVEDPETIIQQALATIRAKTGRHLAAAPLALGAAGAGATRAECDAMLAVGLHLGAAYQLHDDVLGALGAPEQTGKLQGQDLIDGRRTVLVGVTMRLLRPDERRSFVNALLRGASPPVEARVEHLQGVIRRSGALAAVEAMIADQRRMATELLKGCDLDAAGRKRIEEAGDWLVTEARM